MTGLSTFMVMTVILYLQMNLFDSSIVPGMSFTGHVWRLGMMLLIGSASSAILTYLILLKQ